ncbi:MAG: hypothetical protein MI863_12875 [Desulfobacterales bacterium]|nr:hypothetical protein [Desulfobacterales bacterium]
MKRAAVIGSGFDGRVYERVTSATYARAEATAGACVTRTSSRGWTRDLVVDRLLSAKTTGIPIMLVLLCFVLWLTVKGANVPSAFLAGILIEEGGLAGWLATYMGMDAKAVLLTHSLYEGLLACFETVHAPAWLSGFLVDGVYLGLAWVVSVMLPPMAIFFPMFTLLEDLGYLPRVALNMDAFFRAAGAHGKQALTMAMGFGCNAAGVTACRIIESPRERLIAILTNNFVPCNGRWPTLIMAASVFVAASVTPGLAGITIMLSLVAVTLVGVGVTLAVSFLLSRTLLKGVASSFTLEMPPFRPPQVGRVLYTSVIDRTLKVLWRAVVCAAPAGGLIWLLGAIPVGEVSAFAWLRTILDPVGSLIGLDGVILIAFIFAIPANEIVVPTIIMGYLQTTRMVELADPSQLFLANGWTLTTAVCLMLFSLLHYPCTTTTMTIWKETGSVKWTLLSNLIPLGVSVVVCFSVARLMAFF